MSFDARKNIFELFSTKKIKICIFFVRSIRKIHAFFLGVTVETQENIVSKKVREENILKLANTQRVNIQSKNF